MNVASEYVQAKFPVLWSIDIRVERHRRQRRVSTRCYVLLQKFFGFRSIPVRLSQNIIAMIRVVLSMDKECIHIVFSVVEISVELGSEPPEPTGESLVAAHPRKQVRPNITVLVPNILRPSLVVQFKEPIDQL
jgi:hypothetical protein